jgi:clan AA aspartic protease
MGVVHADIELINAVDLGNARRYKIGEDEIRRLPVTMLVDSGSVYMCINETIREYLQLEIIEQRKGVLADGRIGEFDVAGPIEVRFMNRRCHVDAMVLPGDSEPLLGLIPMEDMDVIIHPLAQQLIVNPDSMDMALMKLKGIKRGWNRA